MNFYKLYQGDCFKVFETIEDETVDLILTDPPYNQMFFDDIDLGDVIQTRNYDFEKTPLDIKKLLDESKRVLRDGGGFYFFCGANQISHYIDYIEKIGMRFSNFLTWYQKGGRPSVRKRSWQSHCQLIVFGHKEDDTTKYTFNFSNINNMKNLLEYEHSVSFEYKGGSPGEYLGHPTQKPSKLFQHLINVSSNENDLILDPFLGSGTTLFSCQNTRRSCIGIELDEKYVKMTYDRCFHRRFLDREVKYEFIIVESEE